MAHLMICPNCGAPLPKEAVAAAFAVCSYCRATANIESRVVTQRAESTGVRDNSFDAMWTQRADARKHFEQALRTEASAGPVSYARLRELCAQHLDVYGQTDAVAHVAYNLALDYEAETRVDLRSRGDALARLALGYLNAVETLRTATTYELNMPFIAATDQGPLHYSRDLDVPTLIALSDRDPETVVLPTMAPPLSPTTGPNEAAAAAFGQKRGFWSKLFG